MIFNGGERHNGLSGHNALQGRCFGRRKLMANTCKAG